MSRKVDIEYMKTYLSNLSENISNEFTEYQNIIYSLKVKITELLTERESMMKIINNKDDELCKTHKQLQELMDNVAKLKEDNAAFSKVSHIIAMEKENSKLRAEVEFFKSKLEKNKVIIGTQVSEPTILEIPVHVEEAPVQTISQEAPVILEKQVEEAIEEEFYEKTIKGVVYYISEKTSLIYKKNDDEEIGDNVGRLEKIIDNKTKVTKSKVTWYT